MPLYVLLIAVLVISGVTMGSLQWAFAQPATDPWKIRPEEGRKLNAERHRRLFAINSTISPVLVFGVAYGAYGWLFYEGAVSVGRVLFEAAAILLIYDFFYYLAHRFVFHDGPMHRHHAVHHAAKHPQAADSLYVHPLETVVGLVIMMACTWLVGPVHIYAFSLMFLVYSVMNILIHAGLQPTALPWLGYMARKHDTHHVSMKSGNYASITPIFDLVFGTAE